MVQLTQKQKEILAFIREYIAEKGFSPILEEIAEGVAIDSRAGVHYHLKTLEKQRFIRKKKSIGKRAIELVNNLDFTRIPILGIANAGQPLVEATEDRFGIVEVDSKAIRNKGSLFAVKISGDSMNNEYAPNKMSPYRALLQGGNIAIIDPNTEIVEGDIVLAIINGGATIKIYKKTKNAIALTPNSSNPKHQPIFIFDNQELFINGKVVLALDMPKI